MSEKSRSNTPTENRPRRFEFWLTPESDAILAQVEAAGVKKSDYVNAAIAAYSELEDGKMPILDEKTVTKLAKKIAAELKKY